MSRILFIAKREPQRRDLVTRPYGRFHFLPTELARRGHEVRMLLVSHAGAAATKTEHLGVRITTFDPRQEGLLRTLAAVDAEACAWTPEWVVGCSDAWYGWLARRIAGKAGARLAIDAYDNYEAYMPWNWPLHWQWRKALREAHLTTAAGPQLAALLDRERGGKPPSVVIPMAADPEFVARDRTASRVALGLPLDAPLVGYCGSWTENRGSNMLLEAFRRVRQQRSDTRLVLTGRPPEHALAEPGVHALGYVADDQLPLVLSSLDAACVVTADTPFGRYSYPAKLCEAMACQVPVVATATDAVRWMLHGDEAALARTGDAEEIAQRLLQRLDGPSRIVYPKLPSWAAAAASMEAALMERG